MNKKRLLLFVIIALAVILAIGIYTIVNKGPSAYKMVNTWGSKGSGDGQFMDPQELAWDAQGNLLVSDSKRADVQVFTAHGKFLAKFPHIKTFKELKGLAVSNQGNIFVSDTEDNKLFEFDSSYQPVKSFMSSQENPDAKPEYLSIDLGRNLICVADSHSNQISIFDMNGKLKRAFGKAGSGKGEFRKPQAAKVAPNGNIYIVDKGNNRIQVFDINGKFLFSWGQKGSGPGEFEEPMSLAFDREGRLFVSESGNSRVQIFDLKGNYIDRFGAYGVQGGYFRDLHGIAVDANGNVYVVDSGNHRIQVFKEEDIGPLQLK